MAFYETLHPPQLSSRINHVLFSKKKKVEDERKKWVMGLLKEEEAGRVGNLAYLVPPPRDDYESWAGKKSAASQPQYFITCAAFGKHGQVLWAVTK